MVKVLILFSFLFLISIAQIILYVDPIHGNRLINNDCTNPMQPCQTLTQATENLQPNTIINLLPGRIEMNRSNRQLFGNTTIVGLGVNPNDTIIDCQGIQPFNFQGTSGSQLTIRNMQFENGGTGGTAYFRLDNSNPKDVLFDWVNFVNHTGSLDRGCISFQSSNIPMRIQNCLFENISSIRGSSDGIGIWVANANVTITKTIFRFVNGRNAGGAITVVNGGASIDNCTFSDCQALNGGAIRIFNSPFTITNTYFSNNRAFGGGGAIYISGSSTTIVSNSFFLGGNDGLIGGANAIFCFQNTNLFISGSIFEDLTSSTVLDGDSASAGAISSNCFTKITGSIFRRISTGVQGIGSAILQGSRTLLIDNCQFEDLIGLGAVAIISNGVSTIRDSTFTKTVPASILTDNPSLTLNLEGNIVAESIQMDNIRTLNIIGSLITDRITQSEGIIQFQTDFTLTGTYQVGNVIIRPGSTNLTFIISPTGSILITEQLNVNDSNMANFQMVNQGRIVLTREQFPNSNRGAIVFSNLMVTNQGTIDFGFGEAIGNANIMNKKLGKIRGNRFTGYNIDTEKGGTFELLFGSDIFATFGFSLRTGSFFNAYGIPPFFPTENTEFRILSVTSANFNIEINSLSSVNGFTNLSVDNDFLNVFFADLPLQIGDDFFEVTEDIPFDFTPIINDIASGGNISVSSFPKTTLKGGTLSISKNPNLLEFSGLVYTPPPNFFGQDSFDYKARAANNRKIGTGTVTFSVIAVNDPPMDIEDYKISTTSTSTNIELRAVDIDSDPSITIRSLPEGGPRIFTTDGIEILTIPFNLPNRNIIYVGNLSTSGVVQYFVIDQEGQRSSTIKVTINVNNNDPDNTAAIVGGVLGGLIFCLCITVLITFYFARRPLASHQAKKALEDLLLKEPFVLQRAVNSLLPSDEWPILIPALFSFFGYKSQLIPLLGILIKEEVNSLKDDTLVFRNNNLTTRIMGDFARLTGRKFMKAALEDTFIKVLKIEEPLELDPLKLVDKTKLEENMKQFAELVDELLKNIVIAVREMPNEFHQICHLLFQEIETKFQGKGSRSIASFLFLRYLCPAINAPTAFGLSKSTPTKNQKRTLLLLSKILQTWANQSQPKEEYLEKLRNITEKYNLWNLVESATALQGDPTIHWSSKRASDAFDTLHGYIWKFTDMLYNLEEVQPIYGTLAKILASLGPPQSFTKNEIELELLRYSHPILESNYDHPTSLVANNNNLRNSYSSRSSNYKNESDIQKDIQRDNQE